MSIPNARQSMRLADEAVTAVKALGHLHAARVSLNAAIKSKLAEAVLEDAGQEQLPLAAPAPSGPPVTVAGNGLVLTPSDVAGADDEDALATTLVTPDGEVTTKRRRIPKRRHPIDETLPTEADLDAREAEARELATAAAAADEPDWSTVV